jgi:hypothetical protein
LFRIGLVAFALLRGRNTKGTHHAFAEVEKAAKAGRPAHVAAAGAQPGG